MIKKKKLDIFNLFYSGAAVVILIGVIAKLLEWPMQDLLITGGLAIEAVVFGVSAIKYIDVENELKNVDAISDSINSNVEDNLEDTSLSSNKPSSKYHLKDIQYSETSWGLLEQMNILSITKEMYFQPDWINLKSNEYLRLTELFMTLFEKKLPSKETLPFLINFPVKIPVNSINNLELSKSHVIQNSDFEIVFKSFSLIKPDHFFNKFIAEQANDGITLRVKKDFEIQYFDVTSDQTKAYIKKFHNLNLILSPNLDFLSDNILLKGDTLIEYLIENIDLNNIDAVISLSKIIKSKSDYFKEKLWVKANNICYDLNNNNNYSLLKEFVSSMLTVNDKILRSSLIAEKIELVSKGDNRFYINEVVNYSNEIVLFGQDDEYKIKLVELFPSDELDKLKYLQSLIDRLVVDNVGDVNSLNILLNLSKQDSSEDLLRKLNRHLSKNNKSATGAQLSFVLLCKVYNNS